MATASTKTTSFPSQRQPQFAHLETRFVELMTELFQLDEAEALDFGLYRIIRRHNREVRAFLGEIVVDKLAQHQADRVYTNDPASLSFEGCDRYQGMQASISLADGSLLAGDIPAKQLRMVQVWIDLHQEELMADWELAKQGEELFRIDPLR